MNARVPAGIVPEATAGGPPACPLCRGKASTPYLTEPGRDYFQCPACRLVYLHPAQRLDRAAEKAQYDLHRNHPDDPSYRRFLGRAADVVISLRPAPANALDFGCGPGPTLSLMLREAGYQCVDYDPVYAPDESLLQARYDIITCTEVIEHVHAPHRVWPMLIDLLEPGGLLVVMTKRVSSQQRFANWHYRQDPTHVCFYSEASFQWIAEQFQLKLQLHGDDVISISR